MVAQDLEADYVSRRCVIGFLVLANRKTCKTFK
jgi:hypothetical protein